MNNYNIEIHPKGAMFVGYVISNDEVVFTTPEFALTSLVSESITEYLSKVQQGQNEAVAVAVAPAVFVGHDGTTSVQQVPATPVAPPTPSVVTPYNNPAPGVQVRKCCGRG